MSKRVDGDRIAEFMAVLASVAGEEPRLPEASTLLSRARLRARLAEEDAAAERAARPVVVVGLLGPFLASLALSALVAPRCPPAAAAVVTFGSLVMAVVLPLMLAED